MHPLNGQVLSQPGRRAALRVALRAAALGTAGAAAGGLTAACGPGRPDTAPSGSPPGPPRPARPAQAAPAAAPRRFAGQPVEIGHGPRDRPRVALTFHGNGDPAIARAVLAAAEKGARGSPSWRSDPGSTPTRSSPGASSTAVTSSATTPSATSRSTTCPRRRPMPRSPAAPSGSSGSPAPSAPGSGPPRPSTRPPRPETGAAGGLPARPLVRRGLPRLHLARCRGRHPHRHRDDPARIGGEPALRLRGHGRRDASLLEELARRKLRAVTTTELLTP